MLIEILKGLFVIAAVEALDSLAEYAEKTNATSDSVSDVLETENKTESKR